MRFVLNFILGFNLKLKLKALNKNKLTLESICRSSRLGVFCKNGFHKFLGNL